MGHYLSPRFLDRLAVHITKNFVCFPGVNIPLILGIHGRKGEGKSFQCELVFDAMGIEPIRMSAGELESPDAGDPVRLIRTRYREAAELVRVRGKMCVLLINDLDAGAGRLDQTTQYTVNTQLVNGTLMNIADNPTDVQLPGSYQTEPNCRIPILVTGNDFSTLYAPLVRDGRMDKFFWQPTLEERLGIVQGIFAADGLSPQSVEQLVAHFSTQSIDFFGALRSRLYDQSVRQLIQRIGIAQIATHVINVRDRASGSSASLPVVNVTLDHLLSIGELIVQENQRLSQSELSQDYLRSGNVPATGRNRNFPAINASSSSPASSSDVFSAHSGTLTGTLTGTLEEIREDNRVEAIALQDKSLFQEQRILQRLEQVLLQDGELRLEIASPREKAANAWRSWSWPVSPTNSAIALTGIHACIAENGKSFIKLIGYNPRTQTRLMEELIVKPV
jgi:ribulose bisphosphate carboxylase small subunit